MTVFVCRCFCTVKWRGCRRCYRL